MLHNPISVNIAITILFGLRNHGEEKTGPQTQFPAQPDGTENHAWTIIARYRNPEAQPVQGPSTTAGNAPAHQPGHLRHPDHEIAEPFRLERLHAV